MRVGRGSSTTRRKRLEKELGNMTKAYVSYAFYRSFSLLRFRESIEMGSFEGDPRAVDAAISELRPVFGPDMYNIMTNNCNHLSDALCRHLLQKPIPGECRHLLHMTHVPMPFSSSPRLHQSPRKYRWLLVELPSTIDASGRSSG